MKKEIKKWFSLDLSRKSEKKCGCASSGCGGSKEVVKDGYDQVFDVNMSRRQAFRKLTAGLLIGAGAANSSCSVTASDESKEKSQIDWNISRVITSS